MKTKIINAFILEGDIFHLLFGEILIDDGKIIKVSKKITEEADNIIDAKNNLVMPGFINCNTQSPMSLFKNIYENQNTILEHEKAPDIFDILCKDEFCYYGAMLSIMEMLKGGITSFCDSSLFGESVLKAIKNSGIRANVCLGFHSVKDDIDELEKQYLKLVENNFDTIQLSFYAKSIYDCLPSQFDKLNELRYKYNVPLYTNVSQTLEEVGKCVKEFNKTPVQLLEEYGFFDGKSTVVHAVCLDKPDYEILNQYDVNVVACPSSNLKSASGISPICALKNSNINISVGTDSNANNNQLNMFKEMFLINVLQRVQMRDENAISNLDILKMATINGARVVNYDNLGIIKEGYCADLIIIDLHGINFLNACDSNIKDQLIFNANNNDVLLTMVNGKVIYDNGKFYINEDIEDIKQKCENINFELFF